MIIRHSSNYRKLQVNALKREDLIVAYCLNALLFDSDYFINLYSNYIFNVTPSALF